jgi:hypothetical protein
MISGVLWDEAGTALSPTSALVRQPESWNVSIWNGEKLGPDRETKNALGSSLENSRRTMQAGLKMYEANPEEARRLIGESVTSTAASYGQLYQYRDDMNDVARKAFDSEVAQIQGVVARISPQALQTWTAMFNAYTGEGGGEE